ncbi:MAG: hypothetical protein MUF24_02265, partial [Chitinophagaceae bacterium]|nr:hypothetical protein [Chitinophagaceae bacterium]
MKIFVFLLFFGLVACTQDRTTIEAAQIEQTTAQLTAAQWRIKLFIEDGDDYTRRFENYRLVFSADGKLSIVNATAERRSEGRWRFFEDDGKTEFEISLLTGNTYEDLNDDWYVVAA